MSAISFVVRSDAGVVERGALSGSGNIVVGAGQDISLNLQRSHILSYMRQGQALQITLVDGQVITIEGFFGPDGAIENQLFISSSGQLAEVQLGASDGNLFYAQYADADSFGKWSPEDDLYFVQAAELPIAGVEPASEAGMLGVPLMAGLGGLGGLVPAAAAAAAGGALLLGGGDSPDAQEDVEVEGGGGGVVAPGPKTPDEADPTDPTDPVDPVAPLEAPVVAITDGTKSQGHVVNDDDHKDGIDLSGTGTPGATGTITVGGVTKPIAVDESGNWSATFDPSEVDGGEYEVDVTVTISNAGGSATTTDVLVVDTFTTVGFDASTVESDGTVNFVEETDGVVLTGTTQAGSSVVVSFGGNEYTAVVAGEAWTLSVPAGTIAQGEYDVDITVTATDAYGNTASTSDTLHIDTLLGVSVDTASVETDGVVNMVERSDGVTLTGTSDAGANVQVVFENGVRNVVADSDGNWSADFAASEIRTGNVEVGAPVTVTATDAAGNVATTSGTVQLDTYVNRLANVGVVEGDDVVNNAEASDGITLQGVVEQGSSVSVTFEGVTRTATVNGDGTWSVNFAASEIPSGEYVANVQIDATDAAGNVASITDTFTVDTIAPDAPNIQGFGKDHEGVDTVRVLAEGDTAANPREFHAVENGSDVDASQLDATGFAGPQSQTWYTFPDGQSVPDGSHIVVTDSDAAGNDNSTLFVLDDIGGSTVDVTGAGLDAFNIGAIDLEFAEDSELTLSLADLESMSRNDNTLIVHGNSDDTVTLEAAATAAGTTTIDNKTYDVYTVGDDGGKLIIGEDVNLITPVV